MFDDERPVIQDYVLKNRDLFTAVQDMGHRNVGTSRLGEHTILNYTKILDEMIKYIKGYREYKSSGEKNYKHKVLDSTYTFYNKMFESDKYRKNISLSDFPDMNYKFIERSKELNAYIRKMKQSVDNETLNMARVTEKQYKKLAKVNHDDMLIYMWLMHNQSISPELRSYYNDPTTPVMHKANSKSK
jgi:hypothetical protein